MKDTIAASTTLTASAAAKKAHEALRDKLAPTPELRQHHRVVEEETMVAGKKRRRIDTQRTLDRYLAYGQLDEGRVNAGNRLYKVWYQAGGMPIHIAAYAVRIDKQSDWHERKIEASLSVEKALNDRRLGGSLTSILIAVCLHDEAAGGWAQQCGRSRDGAMDTLRDALERLSLYYQASDGRG